MKFVLFRHAHKGVTPLDDPELSAQGVEQAGLITGLVKLENLPKPTHLFVSPKRRTTQTFYPTSKEFGLNIKIQPDLDQRGSHENNSEFRNRVQHFLQQIQDTEQSGSIIYACTHYDWIEESMTLINCDKDLNSFAFSHWPPTQYAVFEIQSNLWKFIAKGTAK